MSYLFSKGVPFPSSIVCCLRCWIFACWAVYQCEIQLYFCLYIHRIINYILEKHTFYICVQNRRDNPERPSMSIKKINVFFPFIVYPIERSSCFFFFLKRGIHIISSFCLVGSWNIIFSQFDHVK